MKKLLVAGIVAATFCSAPALAADMPAKAPVYSAPVAAPVFNWTGFYVGLDAGGASATQDVSDVACATCNTDPASGTLKGSSFIGGVYAGYNWQFAPTWVAGIEADWSWTRLNATTTAPQTTGGSVDPLPQINSWSRNVKWLASLRGRIGITPTPTALLYVTGGAAWNGTDYSAQDIFSSGCNNCALTSFSKTKSGYVIGGGGEWAPWANNWLLRAEYLYYHFSGETSTVGLVGFPTLPVTFSWGDLSIQEVRVGAAYKF